MNKYNVLLRVAKSEKGRTGVVSDSKSRNYERKTELSIPCVLIVNQ